MKRKSYLVVCLRVLLINALLLKKTLHANLSHETLQIIASYYTNKHARNYQRPHGKISASQPLVCVVFYIVLFKHDNITFHEI